MAVVTEEAIGGGSAVRTKVRIPAIGVPRVVVAPATVGLAGTVVLVAGLAGSMADVDAGVRVLALVAIAAGAYVVGRAGVAPPPNDDDLARRDTLLRARERALVGREAAVDGALVTLALRGDDRAAPGALRAPSEPPVDEPGPAADVDRGARSRRPGLRAIGGPGADDGVTPGDEDGGTWG